VITDSITASATDHGAGVAVEVGPAGALRGVTITARAMCGGAEQLAATVLRLCATATATANRRTALALDLATLPAADRAALGVQVDPADLADDTVPESWEVL
jgi:hypothetical protein